MVRQVDTKMTVIKEVFYTQIPRRHSMPPRTSWGSNMEFSRQRKPGENVGERLDCGFQGKEGIRRQGKGVYNWLV